MLEKGFTTDQIENETFDDAVNYVQKCNFVTRPDFLDFGFISDDNVKFNVISGTLYSCVKFPQRLAMRKYLRKKRHCPRLSTQYYDAGEELYVALRKSKMFLYVTYCINYKQGYMLPMKQRVESIPFQDVLWAEMKINNKLYEYKKNNSPAELSQRFQDIYNNVCGKSKYIEELLGKRQKRK